MDIVVDELAVRSQARGEAWLVQRARRGDRRAYASLVERYWDRLFASIRFLVPDDKCASAAAQSTFLRLYSALPALTSGGAFRDWLFQVGYEVVFRDAPADQPRSELVEMSADDVEWPEAAAAGRARLLSVFCGRRVAKSCSRKAVEASDPASRNAAWRRIAIRSIGAAAIFVGIALAGAWIGDWASSQVATRDASLEATALAQSAGGG